MKTIAEITKERITKDVKGNMSQYGVSMGVSEYTAANYRNDSSKTAWTKVTKQMPWVADGKEFVRVAGIIEAAIIETVINASEEHDVSRNAIEQIAVMAVQVDSWKRVIVTHMHERHQERRAFNPDIKSKSENTFRKEFDKEIGRGKAFAATVNIWEVYKNVMNRNNSQVVEDTIIKIVRHMVAHMVAAGIIIVTDTKGKKNGGIKEAFTIQPSIIGDMVNAIMDVRGDSNMSQVRIGEHFPDVTFNQVTNPKISIEGKNVAVFNPIADVNTPESMAAVMSAIDKSNKVAFVIDRDYIEVINSIPDDVWQV